MANEIDIQIEHYTVLGRIGRGGMAEVFLARDERLDRLVAIKVIDNRYDTDDEFLRRFEREAKTAAGLDHPNVVPIYEFGTTQDGRPFLAMRYVEGGSLRDRLRKKGPLPVSEALPIARQIASALAMAHGRGIIHRDLKPDNVLFQAETA